MTTKTRRPDGTLTALQGALKLGKRRITTLLAEGMPSDVEGALQWRAARESACGTEDLRRHRIILLKEQSRKAKLEGDVAAGLLVSRAEVFEDAFATASAVKRALLALLGSLPPRLVGLPNENAIHAILKAEFYSCLLRLSDGTYYCDPEIRAVIESFKTEKP